jgi:hypothetical protein
MSRPKVAATAAPPEPARLDLSGRGVRHARALPALAAGPHAPHPLHGGDALWLGKGCPVGPWIELLAALNLDPHALWPGVVALDFEGDQWTAFRPPQAELRALYGIDVQPLAVWRPLAEHVVEQLVAGRLLALEVDAFWLAAAGPEVHRREHAKTTILLEAVDLDRRRAGFFHDAHFVQASGDDVAHLLELEDDTSELEAIADWRGSRVAEVGAAAVALAEGRLAPHAEIVRTDRHMARSTEELQMLALHHLGSHLALRPSTNPLRRLAARLVDDLPLLRDYGEGYGRQWAANTLRPLGAAFELAARGIAWQDAPPASPLHGAARAFERIARDAKTLDQKLARAIATSAKPAGLPALLEGMAQAWDDGMAALDEACQGCGR